ncbi:MAG: pilus assembly protein TadG-related protein [Roseovarius sp.]
MKRRNALKTKLNERLKANILAWAARHGKSFEDEEEGGMTIIALFVFILMLTMGGISIDLMRHEMERTQLQATLDSAVLAGAGAPAGATKQQIKEIVEDFFVKSGKADYLNELGDDDIIATLNSRRVAATANMTLNTYLMKLMGVNTLNAGGGATAEVRTPKLEIVLVLDVSGSMRGTKLANLKIAAKEFITTILNSSDPGSTLISIVPYSWGVTPSKGMYEALSVAETHSYSSCIKFEEADFDTAVIDDSKTYEQRIYTSVEVWNSNPEFGDIESGLLTDATSAAYNRTCFTDDYFVVMPMQTSETLLHAKIDSLEAAGSTSSHLGMKWAAGILDPNFADVVTSLQTPRPDGLDENGDPIMVTEIDPTLTNVPALYTESDTQKIIVLMGDGKNDGTYEFTAGNYRGADSYLHEIIDDDPDFEYMYNRYNPSQEWHGSGYEWYCGRSGYEWLECIYEPALSRYIYNPNNSTYYSVEETGNLNQTSFDNLINGLPDEVEHPETGENVPAYKNYNWEEAWGLISPNYIGELTGNWTPKNDIRNNREGTSTKDPLMGKICTATKTAGVRVYSIGFEVAENGTAETGLRNCASSVTNYYRAAGVNISDAFGSIASNVQNLRLTQ